MNKVFVLDKNKQPLMPCLPVRARELLNKGKATVYKIVPFTIIIKDRTAEESSFQDLELKLDPGAGTTGIAINAYYKRGVVLIFAANLKHRAFKIVENLTRRKMLRVGRRARKLRYREKRFDNRKKSKPKGWLPPSSLSILNNINTWIDKLKRRAPIGGISIEINKFDTQKLEDPTISGKGYQQGTLVGTNIKEYLLTKHNHTCVYCDATNVSLQIDHIVPKSKGGSNSVGNLTIACVSCNQKKSNLSLKEFIKDPARLKKIQANIKKPLKDTAQINKIRNRLKDLVVAVGLPYMFGDGGETKFNRTSQKYPKDHFIDAACLNHTGKDVYIKSGYKPLYIEAMGRGDRQVVSTDKYGFPSTSPVTQKRYFGFITGDLVKFTHTVTAKVFRVNPRKTGTFNITDIGLRLALKLSNKKLSNKTLDKAKALPKEEADKKAKTLKLPTSVNYKKLKLVQYNDGFKYSFRCA